MVDGKRTQGREPTTDECDERGAEGGITKHLPPSDLPYSSSITQVANLHEHSLVCVCVCVVWLRTKECEND